MVERNGQSALDVIKRRAPDLAILDCNMPGLSGVQVLRELRKSPALFKLPVLMLTGRQSDADEDIVRFEGANDYLRKPFDPRCAGRSRRSADERRTPLELMRRSAAD